MQRIKCHGREQVCCKRSLADLLKCRSVPTRSSLLASLSETVSAKEPSILERATEKVRSLYFHLEESFEPLKLVSNVKPILDELKEDNQAKEYVITLASLLVVRLAVQLSKVRTIYSSRIL